MSELFGETDKIEPDEDVVVEQKTFESAPVTKEEMELVREQFYDEDVTGGFHNIEPPPEAIEELNAQQEAAQSFIIMQTDNDTNIAHKIDGVNVIFTPEEMVVLIQILEKYSVNMKYIEYAEDVMGMESTYDQQALVRHLRDRVDDTLDEYAKHRPYSPFLMGWLKKIGKDKVRKEQ